MGDFAACVDFTLGMEGGYGADPDDPGNWTGGAIGQGQLRGTNFGISAASYPTLDIAHLTREAAEAIYQRDYWAKINGDYLAGPMAPVVFDASVNNGLRRAIMWLQQALDLTADGVIGPETLAAMGNVDPRAAAETMLILRLDFMVALADWPRFAGGWGRRLVALAFFAAGQ
ncbi:hypothetical protein ACOSOMT5_P1869 [Acidiphilium sp. MT5]